VRHGEVADALLDGVLAVEHGNAGPPLGAGARGEDQVSDAGLGRCVRDVEAVTRLTLGPGLVRAAGGEDGVDAQGGGAQAVRVVEVCPHDLGAAALEVTSGARAGVAGRDAYLVPAREQFVDDGA
jgi:hypothetical protein